MPNPGGLDFDSLPQARGGDTTSLDFSSLPAAKPMASATTGLDFDSLPKAGAKFGSDYPHPPQETPSQTMEKLWADAHPGFVDRMAASVGNGLESAYQDVAHPSRIGRALSSSAANFVGGLTKAGTYVAHDLPKQIIGNVAGPNAAHAFDVFEGLPGGVSPEQANQFSQFANQAAQNYQDPNAGIVAHAVGGLPELPLAFTPLGRAVMVAQGTGSNVAEAQEAGASPRQQLGAALVGAGTTAAQAGYMGELGGPGLEGLSPFTKSVAHVGTGAGVMGGTQLAQNAYARATYDPSRDLMAGVPEQVLVGGGLGAGGALAGHFFRAKMPTEAAPPEATSPMPETHPGVAAFTQAEDSLPVAQAVHQARWTELGQLQAKHKAGGLTPEEQHRYITLDNALRTQGAIGDGPDSLVIPGMYSREAMVAKDRAGELGPVYAALDLDNFKAFNETVGHRSTDYLVQQGGSRIADGLPEGTIVARGTNGDEFYIRGNDPAAIKAHLDKVAHDLKTTPIQVTDPDGNVRQVNGIGLSYGIGEDANAAESALAQHKDAKLKTGDRFTRAQVEDAIAAEAANRRSVARGESPERRSADLGPAARAIPTVIRAAEPGENGIVGSAPFGGSAQGGEIQLPVEVGASGSEGGEPGAPGTPAEPALTSPSEAAAAARSTRIGTTEGAPEAPAGSATNPQTGSPEEVAPTLNYINGNGEKVEAPLVEPHHQDAARAIEDEFQARKERAAQIPGDDPASKALRRKLYLQAADDRAQAKAALHVQMEEEALGNGRVGGEVMPEHLPGWTPEETANLDAPAGTPEAEAAMAKLHEPVKRLIETSQSDVSPANNPKDVGSQYEQARQQETVDAINAIKGVEQAKAVAPEDQSKLRDAVEDEPIHLPPWLQKFRDAVVEPLRASILKDYLELKVLKGEPPNNIDAAAEVAHATRHALPDVLEQEPSWWKRLLNIRSFDPGEQAHEFRLKGLGTTERGEKARSYKAMVDARGNREVVHLSGRGEAEGVKSGNTYKRTSLAQALKDRLEGPTARLNRAIEKARTAFEETTKRLPERLARQADKLEAEGKGRADVLKKIMTRSVAKSARVMRDLLSERHEIEHAFETGDKGFFQDHNPKLVESERKLRDAVNKEFWKASDAQEKVVEEKQQALDEARAAKKPSGRIYDLEKDLEDATRQLRDQREVDAMQHPDKVIASSEDLQAKQKAFQDAVKAERDRMLKPLDAKIRAEMGRDERNQAFLEKETGKTQDIQAEANQKGTTSDVLDHRYDHMEEPQAIEAAAKDHPRVARALESVRKARAEVQAAEASIGHLDQNQRYFQDKAGNLFRQTEARTREIEATTNTRYDKNYLHNLYEQAVNMKKAVRNMKLIQGWQRTPEEGGWGYRIPKGDKNPKLPPGYATTKLKIPGFEEWAFPEPMARSLDHLQMDLERAKSPHDILQATQAINRLFVRSIFLNPFGHMQNTAYHAFTNKGWRAFNPNEFQKGARGFASAMKRILNMDPSVQKLMNEGSPMMSQNPRAGEFQDMLHEALLPQLRQIRADDPRLVKWAAKIGAPAQVVASEFSKRAGQILWTVDDALRIEAIETLKRERPNLSTKEASAIVARGIADYRSSKGMPTWFRAFSENPSLFMFSRYHQFRAWAFFHDLKNAYFPKASEGTSSLQARQDAMGKLAATALLFTVGKALLTPMYQAITGDKEAQAPFAGSLAIPSALISQASRTEGGSRVLGGMSPSVRSAIYGGPRSAYQDVQDFFTLTPGANIAAQEGIGRNLFSGRSLSSMDRAKLPLEAISPVGQASIASRNPRSGWANLMSSFGARYKGSPAAETAKAIARENYGTAAPTDLDEAQMEAKLNIASALYGKDSQEATKLKADLVDAATRSGALTRKQALAKIQSTIAPPERQLADLVGTFRGPNSGMQAMKVYRVATDDEKRILKPIVQKKLSSATLGAMARAQNAALLKEFTAMNEAHP